MDIDLLSKMVKELILDNERVVLPGLGSFVAEIVPATFSDKGYTINPPYRKLYFRSKPDQGSELTQFYAKSNSVSEEIADKVIVDFITDLKAILFHRKTIIFPGLGRLRATKENNVFFVADEDLDIYPEGFGLEPISLKTHQPSSSEVKSAVSDLKSILTDSQTVMESDSPLDQKSKVEPDSLGEISIAEDGLITEFTAESSAESAETSEEATSETYIEGASEATESEESESPEESESSEESLGDKTISNTDDEAGEVEDDAKDQYSSIVAEAKPEETAEAKQEETADQEEKEVADGEQDGIESFEEELPIAEPAEDEDSEEKEDFIEAAESVRKPIWKTALLVFMWTAIAVVAIMGVYVAVSHLCPEWIDQFLYTPEELELLNNRYE